MPDACEPPPCEPLWALPFEGSVPANMQGLFVHGAPSVEAALQEVTAGLLVPIQAQLTDEQLRIATPLKHGANYQLSLQSKCDASAWNSKFSASEPAALPSELGRLVAVQPQPGALALAHDSGNCAEMARVIYVDVAVELSKDALPWVDLLRFETWVDGKRWQPQAELYGHGAIGGSWFGRGRDRLYATCTSDARFVEPGLAAGAHLVQLRASLPGLEQVLTTPEIRVSLTCPEAGEVFRGELRGKWLEWGLVALLVCAVLGFLLLRRQRSIVASDE